ncbi:MAG: hypothetical protein PHF35_04740 [Candidatus Moranbacteria bacterium]|nr:hypothetical protein [Candidatus Moranbacteria bacterium]
MSDSGMTIYDRLGRAERPAWAIGAVDRLLDKVKSKGMWETIDFVIEIWAKKNPKEAKDFLAYRKQLTNSRKNDTGSSGTKTRSGATKASMRYLCEVPVEIQGFLDMFFLKEISKDKKAFWRKFAKRYPFFRVAKKI